MKYFSILEGMTDEALKEFAEKKGITDYLNKGYYTHPQEDFLLTSDKPPVFVVADGVTLAYMKFLERDEKYPNPSPAGEVAKIFAEALVKEVKERYDTFGEESIIEVFKRVNSAVEEFNTKVGKNDVSGNITGYYSATGSFVVIKENKAYWSSICDSFIAHFDKEMKLKFISSGVCIPYAVINGEERMAEHLEKGVLDLEVGDRIFVFTDGFEPYIRNGDFLKLFLKGEDGIQERIENFSEKMNQGEPEKYGHERSLIVVTY